MASPLLLETVWFDKYKYEDAEKKWQEHIAKNSSSSKNNDITKAVYTELEDDNVKLTPNLEDPISEKKLEDLQDKPVVSCTELPNERKEKQVSQSTIVGEIVRARQHIKNSLQSGDKLTISLNSFGDTSELSNRVQKLENENQLLREMYQSLQTVVQRLESKISALESKGDSSSKTSLSAPSKPQEQPKDDDDDDLDLFGSEEEDEETAKVREQRLKDYEAKKSKKKAVIAKSSVVFDVKPWDDETDMKQLELSVRHIKMDGLVWGASKLVPLAYSIFKLQIACVVEDEKVSIDWLQELISDLEDYVQSVDIAAFNKL